MRTPGKAVRWWTTLATSALTVTLVATLAVLHGGVREVRLEPAAVNVRLCSGYSGCVNAGYPDAGYGAASSRMYWNMYSGHNCTNYAAYRVIASGGPATRPWTGGGNASEWGKRMASITDQVPNVGAIAWWGAYDNGHGSAGHVAYVERVVSANEIVISEDSWGGTFAWRRISKDSGRWPTGFIHFTDKRITPTGAPAISGTPAVGQTLTAVPGAWSAAPSALAYDWLVDNVSSGQTGPTFTLTAAHLGRTIAVRIRGLRPGYTEGVQQTGATAAVAKGTFVQQQPSTVAAPLYVDTVLTASPGVWAPAPTTSSWRWYVDGVRVPNNDGPQLALTQAHLGKAIEVVPIARTDGFTAAVGGRVALGTVLQGAITVTQPFGVSGTPQVGQVLSATGGATAPEADRTFQWLRDGAPIPGATGPQYQLTGDDAGRAVGLRVDLTKTNFAPAVQSPAAARVTSPPRIVVRTEVSGKLVKVVAKVRAPGVKPVKGKVTVRIAGKDTTLKLSSGNARFSIPVTFTGTRKVGVTYRGSSTVPQQRVTTSVRVR